MKSGLKLSVLVVAALLLGQTADLGRHTADPGRHTEDPPEAAAPAVDASESFPVAGLPVPKTEAVAAAPVIAAAGDIACPTSSRPSARASASECWEEYTAQLLGRDLTAVLLLGDNQYINGELEQYQGAYQQTWGTWKAITRPAPGNHEYQTPNATGYYAYFGAAAGDPSKGYYSFDIGAWHLISMNGNCRPVGGCGEGSPQETWLRKDLDEHRGQCTLAYWHQPRWSSGIHGNDSAYGAFWRALYRARADLVLNGHDHDYERFALQDPGGNADVRGIREFVVGTGGFSHYRFPGPPLPNTEARNDDTFGVLKLTLRPAGYDWQFVPAAGSGSFTDAGSGTCHSAS
jgi:hypothetical protein